MACRSRRRCRPRRLGAARLRAGLRLLLRAPHQDLFRHADARFLANRLGDLLQMERCHRRRSGTCPTCPIPISAGCRRSRLLGDLRIAEQFYLLTLVAGHAVARGDTADHRLAVRPDADDDPREPGARRLRSASTSAPTSSPPSSSPAASPASPARCSASSTAVSSPITSTGRNPPR